MKKETLKKANAFINRNKQAGITGQSQGALVSDLPKVAHKPTVAPTTPVADATMPAATKPVVPLKSIAEKKADLTSTVDILNGKTTKSIDAVPDWVDSLFKDRNMSGYSVNTLSGNYSHSN